MSIYKIVQIRQKISRRISKFGSQEVPIREVNGHEKCPEVLTQKNILAFISSSNYLGVC